MTSLQPALPHGAGLPRLRLLHVHSGNMLGGVESVLLAQAAAAADERSPLHVEFALSFEGEFGDRLNASGALCHYLGAPRLRHPLRLWQARRRLRALLSSGAFDVVAVHSGWSQTLFAPVLAASRTPWVRWQHAPPDLSLWLDRAALRYRPALVVCNSAFTRTASLPVYAGVPCPIVYCPVEPAPASTRTMRDDVRRELATGERDVVIAIVGRFEPLKGHHVLVRALARIEGDPRWTCWIIGAPQSAAETIFRDEVRALAERLNIADRLRFTGQVADIHRLLGAVDVCCQPNTRPEGFGMAIAEALAASIPVVTTAIGGGAEIVTAECGILVPAGDPVALAAALLRMVSDADLRAHLAAAAGPCAARIGDRAAHVRTLVETLAAVAPAGHSRGDAA